MMNQGERIEKDYECTECSRGILTLRSWKGSPFVWGRCNRCGHEVEFELPDEALQEDAA